MNITETNVCFNISTSVYALNVSADMIDVFLSGESVARLIPGCILDVTNETKDGCYADIDEAAICFCQKSECPAVFEWKTKSNLWEEKLCHLTCYEDRAEFTVTVKGKGNVDSVKYFTYNKQTDDKVKQVKGSQDFYEGFYPNIYEMGEEATYRADREKGVNSTLTVPTMFLHAFKTAGINEILSFSVVAEMGEHNFTKLVYDPDMYFTTDQDGHTHVDGCWTAPKVVITTADSYYNACEKYRDYYFENGICEKNSVIKRPRFWYGPIACGWFEQQASGEPGVRITDMAKESLYRNMLRKFDERDVHPNILIIDDKWMTDYGTATVNTDKWPDLRGFIDENRRERGIHTFLWFRLWPEENECVPHEYCVYDEIEKVYEADPSHPGFREMLKETVHRLISSDEGCYNADGLKVDFGFRWPRGRKALSHSSKYGAELIYEYIKLIHDVAKEAKPHAVINASPAHPMFDSIVDHARLHDYDAKNRRTLEEFAHRAKIWGTALPSSLIDMDGGAVSTNRDVMRFLLGQADYGIPDLYYISDFKHFKLTAEEWSQVSDAWKAYNEKMDDIHGVDDLIN